MSKCLIEAGARLKEERARLGLTHAAMAALAGKCANVQMKWERGGSSPTVATLASYAAAGADVLYIITGERTPIAADRSPPALAGVTIRQALAMLDPPDRHRLLLDLLAGELRA